MKGLIVCEKGRDAEKCLASLYIPAREVVGENGVIDALVLKSSNEKIIDEGFPKGINKAIVVDTGEYVEPVATSSYISDLVRKEGYETVVFNDSRLSLWIAGRIAGLLSTGIVTDVVKIDNTDGISIVRPAYEETLWLKYKVNSRPIILSVRKGSFPSYKEKSVPNEIVEERIGDTTGALRVIEVKKATGEKDLSTAEIVIGVGLGIRKKEDLEIIKELASVLDAAWGVTRPLIDDGWVTKEKQIGHSGVRVAPRLYIAIGLSGASYHVSGVKGSGTIIAINKDPQAPIFKYSDYGLIGDLYDIVPKLTKKLKEKLG